MSASQASSLLTQIADHVLVLAIDTDGKLTACNPVCEQLLGYRFKDMGRQTSPVLNHQTLAVHLYRDDECLLNVTLRDRQGQDWPVTMNISKIKDKQGKTLGYLLMSLEDLLQAMQFDLNQLHSMDVFSQVLAQEFRRSQREETPIGLLYVDVDEFSAYQKYYGEKKAQHCLKRVAHTIHQRIQRAGDFLAYMHFDEFMIVLPNTDRSGCIKLAEYVRLLVAGHEIEHSATQDHGIVTVSIGIAHAVPTRETRVDRLLEDVQIALKEAKHSGRNVSRYFTP